jgi:hypothetical protein
MSSSARSTIIDNPVNINVAISKIEGGWEVTPSLIAYPGPMKPRPKNIIFLLDCSGSMGGKSKRFINVQIAVSNLLQKLTPEDKFSIVSFNTTAQKLVICQHADEAAKGKAVKAMSEVKINSEGTNFKAAFEGINTLEIIPPAEDSTIIFLTDGEDGDCSAKDLLSPFLNREHLRIIPIGVSLRTPARGEVDPRKILHELGNGAEIYIEAGASPDAYIAAFDKAYTMAVEQSYGQAYVEMIIEGKGETDSTKLEVKRTLGKVHYDGRTPTAESIFFPSPDGAPPSNFKVLFDCDDNSLRATHILIPEECKKIGDEKNVNIDIRTFKSKNNTTYSWILAWGFTVVGLLLSASVALSVYFSPDLSLWAWKALAESALASLVGLGLFINGMIAISKKTIFLPTKSAAHCEPKEGLERKLLEQGGDEKRAPEHKSSEASISFFGKLKGCLPESQSIKKFLAGSALVADGATAGYFVGKAASTASAVIAAGISPSLFITVCAAGGAVAFPLLVYILQRCFSKKEEGARHSGSNQPNGCLAWLPSKRFLAGSTFAAGGAIVGNYAGTAASTSSAIVAAGVSPSLFITVCAVGGAIVLPLLVYGSVQIYNSCQDVQPKRGLSYTPRTSRCDF